MVTAHDLLHLDRPALRRLLAEGHAIDPDALADTEYRGTSLGLHPLVDRLAWKTFKKVFHKERGVLGGWNVRIRQTGIDGPFSPELRDGRPVVFGWFTVVRPGDRTPVHARRGLLLDYGAPASGHTAGSLRFLRDPLVALEPGSADVLLGWSYVDFGVGTLPTPSYFCLERDGPFCP